MMGRREDAMPCTLKIFECQVLDWGGGGRFCMSENGHSDPQK